MNMIMHMTMNMIMFMIMIINMIMVIVMVMCMITFMRDVRAARRPGCALVAEPTPDPCPRSCRWGNLPGRRVDPDLRPGSRADLLPGGQANIVSPVLG